MDPPLEYGHDTTYNLVSVLSVSYMPDKIIIFVYYFPASGRETHLEFFFDRVMWKKTEKTLKIISSNCSKNI